MAGMIEQGQETKAPGKPKEKSDAALRVEIAAKKLLAQPEVTQHILAILKAAEDPARGLAEALLFLMMQLYEKSKGTMPPEAIVPAAKGVLLDIAKIGEAAGIVQVTKEVIGQAALLAFQMYKEQMAGQQGEAMNAQQMQAGPESMPVEQPVEV